MWPRQKAITISRETAALMTKGARAGDEIAVENEEVL
jgi:hypothetical protein